MAAEQEIASLPRPAASLFRAPALSGASQDVIGKVRVVENLHDRFLAGDRGQQNCAHLFCRIAMGVDLSRLCIKTVKHDLSSEDLFWYRANFDCPGFRFVLQGFHFRAGTVNRVEPRKKLASAGDEGRRKIWVSRSDLACTNVWVREEEKKHNRNALHSAAMINERSHVEVKPVYPEGRQ